MVVTVDVEVEYTVIFIVGEREAEVAVPELRYMEGAYCSEDLPIVEPIVAEVAFNPPSFLARAAKSNQNGPGLIAKIIPD